MGSWNISSNTVYAQPTDPGAVGGGSFWTDTDANLTYRRLDDNSDWVLVATHTGVSNAEYSYLDGVTSALQTQINTKAPSSGATLTSPTLTTPSITGGFDLKPFSKCTEENASGDEIPTRWTQNNIANTTFAMTDGINSGIKITTGAANGDKGNIHFNSIRHFDPANCTIYGVFSVTNVLAVGILGISNNTGGSDSTGHNVAAGVWDSAGDSYLSLYISDGQGAITASDVLATTGKTAFKIICTASNQKLYLLVGGVWTLKITQSTELPTAACGPVMHLATEENVAKTMTLIYFRVENDT